MAYDARPQYGYPSRSYHGVQVASSTFTPGSGQDSYNERIAPQSYEYYDEPQHAPKQQYSQHHNAEGTFQGRYQQRAYPSPGNYYSEPQYHGQAQHAYTNPTQGPRPIQFERHHGPSPQNSYPENNERPSQRPTQYSNLQSSFQGSVPSSADLHLVRGHYLESQNYRTPLPRSFTNESNPKIDQSQRRQDNHNIDAEELYQNGNLYAANSQSSAPTNEGSIADQHRQQDRRPLKPATKKRTIIDKSTPDTISWDNPFPTFPTNKKKTPQSDSESINGCVASMSIQDESRREGSQGQRPQTANSERAHEPPRSREKQSAVSGVQRDRNPHPQHTESGVKSYQNQFTKPSSNEASFSKAQGEYITAQSQNKDGARPHHRPQQTGHPMQLGRRLEEHQPAPSTSRNLVSNAPPQRSNTLPNEVSETSDPLHLPSTRPEPTPWQNSNQQPKKPSVVRNFALPYQSTSTSGLRNAGHGRSQSDDFHQSRNDLVQEQLPLSRQTPHIQQDSYREVFDSYYDIPNGDSRSFNQQQAIGPRSPLDEDIPNFDAIPGGTQGTNRAPRTDQNMQSQSQAAFTPLSNLPTSSRGHIQNKGNVSDFTGQAHRSRSQPNLKDARQANTNSNHGFDFNSGRNVPVVPSFPPNPNHQQHNEMGVGAHPYSRTLSRNEQRPYPPGRQISPISNEHEHGPPRAVNQGFGFVSNFAPHDVHSIRSQDSRGPSRNQGRAPGTGSLPFNRPGPKSPPPVHGNRTNSDQRRSPGTSLSPNSLNGPTSPPSNYQDNPDALPEHPMPVRPGLLQSSAPTQTPKPAPVRQYNNDPSPVQQSGVAQPPINSSPPKKVEKPVQVTHEELERLRQSVRANPSDQKTQLVLAEKMVEAASVLADDGGRADQKQRAKNREKFILDAHKLVKKLAHHNYPEAMFYLADCHGRGLLGLETDPKEAFNLYLSAAKAAHPQSAYRVAVCCELGQDEGGGTRRDPLKAIQWYKRAATLGDTPAMYKMGMIRLKGLLGQPKYPKEAVVWLKRAADKADEENPHALHELGLLFETADAHESIIKDETYSKQLFTQAADLGYKFSQYRLGSAYEYGLLGCPIDPRQSIAWYSKAAVQEEHQSELALSGWYLTGSEGVLQQSDTEAYLWARKAAQAGLAKAEYAMGYFTEVGIGAPANIEDAKRWYWRAASQNFPKARERLEDLRKGGARMQKSRVSRSAVNKQSDGDCIVM